MEAPKQTVKIRPHTFYTDKFFKKLHEESPSIIDSLTALCGGWYLETFKQVLNKLSKNKSSPLPLFFANIDSMEPISKNKQLLRAVFKAFDTRAIGKIDACELYSAFLILSKGSYETYLKTIVDIFGFETAGRLNRNEFFYFLDSFYRAMPKILLIKGKQKPIEEINSRLDFKDINKFLDILFDEEKVDIERNQIYQALMKIPELNQFLKYVQKRGMSSAEISRTSALEKIKVETEVKKCMMDMIAKIQLNLQ